MANHVANGYGLPHFGSWWFRKVPFFDCNSGVDSKSRCKRLRVPSGWFPVVLKSSFFDSIRGVDGKSCCKRLRVLSHWFPVVLKSSAFFKPVLYCRAARKARDAGG